MVRYCWSFWTYDADDTKSGAACCRYGILDTQSSIESNEENEIKVVHEQD